MPGLALHSLKKDDSCGTELIHSSQAVAGAKPSQLSHRDMKVSSEAQPTSINPQLLRHVRYNNKSYFKLWSLRWFVT